MNSLVKKTLKCALRPLVRSMSRMCSILQKELQESPHLAEGSGRTQKCSDSPFRIDPNFFTSNMSENEKKMLFKNNVHYLLIENSSFCNRKCWFCSNRSVDIKEETQYLSEELFLKILSELKTINYSEDLAFALCNEPLSDRRLPKLIETAKIYLPNVKIHLNTNGDYLNKNLLDDLLASGLDRMLISVYIDEKKPYWSYEKAKLAVIAMANKLSLNMEILSEENQTICQSIGRYMKNSHSLYIVMHSDNHTATTHDRGGMIPDYTPVNRRGNERRKICVAPFTQFVIYHGGEACACHNLRPDYPGHKDFIGGSVGTSSIFDIFAGPVYKKFREDMLRLDPPACCSNCPEDIDIAPHYRLIEQA